MNIELNDTIIYLFSAILTLNSYKNLYGCMCELTSYILFHIGNIRLFYSHTKCGKILLFTTVVKLVVLLRFFFQRTALKNFIENFKV